MSDLGGSRYRAAVRQLRTLNGWPRLFFRTSLPGSWVPPYLRSRGFSSAVQVRWHAGYAPAGWNALTRHLRSLGWPDEFIEAHGLARRSRRGNLFDVFRDRAMFPVTDHRTGPWPDSSAGPLITRRSDVPKYLNSPRTCLYNKSALLFGLV